MLKVSQYKPDGVILGWNVVRDLGEDGGVIVCTFFGTGTDTYHLAMEYAGWKNQHDGGNRFATVREVMGTPAIWPARSMSHVRSATA